LPASKVPRLFKEGTVISPFEAIRQGWFKWNKVANSRATGSNHLPGLRRDSSLSKEESVESSDFTDFYPKYSILNICIRICYAGAGWFLLPVNTFEQSPKASAR
jgi:hypothetical protein